MFGKLFLNKIVPRLSDKYISSNENSNWEITKKYTKFDKRKRTDNWSKLSIQKKRRNTILKLHNENFMMKNKWSPIIRLHNVENVEGEVGDDEYSNIKEPIINVIDEDEDFFNFAENVRAKKSGR